MCLNRKLMKNGSIKTILLSLLAMALWGSLFPMIKIGYKAFNIDTTSIPEIMMFAALRFVISGVIVCIIAVAKKARLESPKPKSVGGIMLVGLFAIVLHYICTYIGLSTTDSSKTALMKQLGVLFYVCFAFLFFKDERFSIVKIVGVLIGFAGIIAINYSSGGISFSVGDILIISASVCTVISSVLSKKSVEGNSPYWITGISQLSGGIVMLVIAIALGGKLLMFTPFATLIFTYICTASIAAYTIWYYVQKSENLSNLFIIKFAEPLFACVFGAILLGENILKIQYLAAFILICAGITIGNIKVKERNPHES